MAAMVSDRLPFATTDHSPLTTFESWQKQNKSPARPSSRCPAARRRRPRRWARRWASSASTWASSSRSSTSGRGEYNGIPIPVIVTVYSDRSFEFKCKSPPASALLKIKAGIAKGSGVPNKEKVGKVTRAQIDEICQGEVGRPQRPRPGARRQHDRRHRPQHGDRRRRLSSADGRQSVVTSAIANHDLTN